MTTTRKCLSCGTNIFGRTDKKFCSDQCRNNHHNEISGTQTNYMRNVNNVLKRNRKVLEELNTTGKIKVKREKLSARGFNFSYFTNIYKTTTGNVYYFCYEQGYLPIENDLYMLVIKRLHKHIMIYTCTTLCLFYC